MAYEDHYPGREKRYYNVVERNDYWIAVERCESIEKLSDSFITEEQLHDRYQAWGIRYYDTSKIRITVKEWAELLGEKKLSTTLHTSEASVMMALVPNHVINACLGSTPYLVHGDRLLHETRQSERRHERHQEDVERHIKEQERIAALPYERKDYCCYDDWINLKRAACKVIENKYGVEANARSYWSGVRKDMTAQENVVRFFKRLMSWTDVRAMLQKQLPKKERRLDTKYAKELWFNPSQVLDTFHKSY